MHTGQTASTAAGARRCVPLAATIFAGAVTGMLSVLLAASFAALMFGGSLAALIPLGIQMGLVTGLVTGAVVAAGGSFPGAVAVPQDRIAPILALLAAAVAAAMPDDAGSARVHATVLAAILLSTLGTGAALALFGRLRLGALIRFIPFPVIGGFLAATGWLLVLGSLQVMTRRDDPVRAMLAEPGVALGAAPGIALALVALVLARHLRHFVVLPGVLLAGAAAFYLVLYATDIGLDGALRAGWVLGPFPDHRPAMLPALDAFAGADWSVLSGAGALFATIVVVSGVSVLLNCAALELQTGRDIRLNRELRVTGTANVLAGLAGGIVGFVSVSASSLALRMGATGRATGLIAASVCLAALLFGTGFASLIPRGVLGALLFFLGVSFLVEWTWDARKRLSRGDHAVVLLILGAAGAFGFLQGMAVGVVGAIVLFVVNYSRVDVVKIELSGAHHRSNVDRPVRDVMHLREAGGRIHILGLQGYIFFGTGNRLVEQVRARSLSRAHALRFLVLDFRRVSGVDSSALLSFAKLVQLGRRSGFVCVFTGMEPALAGRLDGVVPEAARDALVRFPDLDHGVEWCEDRLLREAQAPHDAPAGDHAIPLEQAIGQLLPDAGRASALAARFEHGAVRSGERLIREGDAADDLYYIESGEVTVVLEAPGTPALRLRKMGPGTITGELGIYLGGRRSASVIAERPTAYRRLPAATLAAMERDDPGLAAAFHQWMARLIAERLVNTNRTLRSVMD